MDRFVLFDRCAAQEGHRSSPRGADSLALSYRSIRFVGSSLTAPRVPHCCPLCLRCLGQQKTAMVRTSPDDRLCTYCSLYRRETRRASSPGPCHGSVSVCARAGASLCVSAGSLWSKNGLGGRVCRHGCRNGAMMLVVVAVVASTAAGWVVCTPGRGRPASERAYVSAISNRISRSCQMSCSASLGTPAFSFSLSMVRLNRACGGEVRLVRLARSLAQT